MTAKRDDLKDPNHIASEAAYRAHLRRGDDCPRCREVGTRINADRRARRKRR